MQRIANFLELVSDTLNGWADRIRYRDFPPTTEWTNRPDASRAPFRLPPDVEMTDR